MRPIALLALVALAPVAAASTATFGAPLHAVPALEATAPDRPIGAAGRAAPPVSLAAPPLSVAAPYELVTATLRTSSIATSDADAWSADAEAGLRDIRVVKKGPVPALSWSTRASANPHGGDLTLHRLAERMARHDDAAPSRGHTAPAHYASAPALQDTPLEYHAAPASSRPAPGAPRPTSSQDARVWTAATAPPPSEAPEWIAAGALAAGAALVLLIPFALYHRLRGERALENGRRAKLLALLRTTPGMTQADAARALGVDPTTASYHLGRLVKEGLIGVDEGRHFAAGTVPTAARAALVAEHDHGHVLDIIKAQPGVSKTELAERLGVARTTVAWHVAKLERAGLVRCVRAGRAVRVVLSGA